MYKGDSLFKALKTSVAMNWYLCYFKVDSLLFNSSSLKDDS